MESSGFVFSNILTSQMRSKAKEDHRRTDLVKDMITKNRTTYSVGQHLWGTLQVFINPLVASLPEHQHLFAEHGCYDGVKGKICGKEVKGEHTPLPDNFLPLNLTEDMDKAWFKLIEDLEIA